MKLLRYSSYVLLLEEADTDAGADDTPPEPADAGADAGTDSGDAGADVGGADIGSDAGGADVGGADSGDFGAEPGGAGDDSAPSAEVEPMVDFEQTSGNTLSEIGKKFEYMITTGEMSRLGYSNPDVRSGTDWLSVRFDWNGRRQYTLELTTDPDDVLKNGKVTTLGLNLRKYDFDTAGLVSNTVKTVDIGDLSEKWVVDLLSKVSRRDHRTELAGTPLAAKRATDPKQYGDDTY